MSRRWLAPILPSDGGQNLPWPLPRIFNRDVATVKPSDQAAFARELVGLIKLGLVRKQRSTIYEGETELVLTETGMEALHK
jgi:hypothetical protein